MTVGLHAVNLANEWLDILSNSAFTAKANTYMKLHTGDPGSAGSANASAETERKLITWAAASTGAKAISSVPAWTVWDVGTETLTHISVWDDLTAGNFLYSFALTTPRMVFNGDSFTMLTHTISFTPIAA